MKNRIGIVQGRLLPKNRSKLQVFPSETWEQEFKVAKQCGFSTIELLLDDFGGNPLLQEEGQRKISHLSARVGLNTPSICADFFQKHGLYDNMSMVQRLVQCCEAIGCKKILIPFFGQTQIKNAGDKISLSMTLGALRQLLEEYNINLCLETTLPAAELATFMEEIKLPHIKVYYDLGNSIPLGYNAPDDIRRLAKWIDGIHIKDKDSSGKSVILGTGLVDFAGCFRALREINYEGDYILETCMGDNPIQVAKYHLDFVRGF